MSKKTNEKSKTVAVKADSRDELIAALKGLSVTDMTAILDEVLPEDNTKVVESKEEAESGEEEGTEETKESGVEAADEAKEEVKEDTVDEVKESAESEVEKSDKVSEDFITALTEEFESQAEITKQLAEAVVTLTAKLEELTGKFTESSAKVEKSLDQEEAIEVIAELQKALDVLADRVDSLENTPADSAVVEKSVEVDSGKGKGFLKKYL